MFHQGRGPPYVPLVHQTVYITLMRIDIMTQRTSQLKCEVIIFGKVDDYFTERYYSVRGLKSYIKTLD